MRLLRTLTTAAFLGTAPLVAIQPTSAAQLLPDQALGELGTNAETVQYSHQGLRTIVAAVGDMTVTLQR